MRHEPMLQTPLVAQRALPPAAMLALRAPAAGARLPLSHADPAGQFPGSDPGRAAGDGHDALPGDVPAGHADGAQWLQHRPLGLLLLRQGPRTWKTPITQRLTVYFKDDKVEHVERSARCRTGAASGRCRCACSAEPLLPRRRGSSRQPQTPAAASGLRARARRHPPAIRPCARCSGPIARPARPPCSSKSQLPAPRGNPSPRPARLQSPASASTHPPGCETALLPAPCECCGSGVSWLRVMNEVRSAPLPTVSRARCMSVAALQHAGSTAAGHELADNAPRR